MQQKLRVLGARKFNDSVEGKTYNFTKLRIELPVPRNAENEMGCNVVEALYGKADAYEELRRDYKFPCECFVDLEVTSKGMDVLNIEPVKQSQPAKAA